MIIFPPLATVRWLALQFHIRKSQVQVSARLSVTLTDHSVIFVTPFRQMKGQCLQNPQAFLCTSFTADYSTDFPTTRSCNLSYWLSCAERMNTTVVPSCQFVLFSLWI